MAPFHDSAYCQILRLWSFSAYCESVEFLCQLCKWRMPNKVEYDCAQAKIPFFCKRQFYANSSRAMSFSPSPPHHDWSKDWKHTNVGINKNVQNLKVKHETYNFVKYIKCARGISIKSFVWYNLVSSDKSSTTFDNISSPFANRIQTWLTEGTVVMIKTGLWLYIELSPNYWTQPYRSYYRSIIPFSKEFLSWVQV